VRYVFSVASLRRVAIHVSQGRSPFWRVMQEFKLFLLFCPLGVYSPVLGSSAQTVKRLILVLQ
jgi:hypothetical protein